MAKKTTKKVTTKKTAKPTKSARKKMTTTTTEKKEKELTPEQDALVSTATRAILRHIGGPVRAMVQSFVLHPKNASLTDGTKDTVTELKRLGAALVEAAPKKVADLPEEFTARVGGNKIGEEMWEKILARRREGATYEQLQEEFPVSETTLWKRFKDEGLVSGRDEKKKEKAAAPKPAKKETKKDEPKAAAEQPKAEKKGGKKKAAEKPAEAKKDEPAKAEPEKTATPAEAAKADW